MEDEDKSVNKDYTATIKLSIEYEIDIEDVAPDFDLSAYIHRQHEEHFKGTHGMGRPLNITVKEW